MSANNDVVASKNRDWGFYIAAGLIILAVILVWSGSWWWIQSNIKSPDSKVITDEAARGVFGDQFGAVNALFSGLAFTGVIITLILQRRELRSQSASMQRQQFESGFFQLVAIHSELTKQLDVGGYEGRRAFEKFLSYMPLNSRALYVFSLLKRLDLHQVSSIYANGVLDQASRETLGAADAKLVDDILVEPVDRAYVAQYLSQNEKHHRDIIIKAYIQAHIQSNDALSHYFRTLYHILQYIDSSALIPPDEKRRYAKLVGAQLSGLEIAAILYNSLVPAGDMGGQMVDFGFPAMFNLLKLYELTTPLNANVLFHPIHLDVFAHLTASKAKNV